MRHSLDSPVRPLWEFLLPENVRNRRGVRYGGGGALTTFICGPFFCENARNNNLFAALRSVIHVPCGDSRSPQWLQDVSRILTDETETHDPGAQSIIDHLAQVLFVQAIRYYVQTMSASADQAAAAKPNWLRALFDPEIGPTLGSIHSQPQAPWTVASLADSVAMSRSAFAAKFTAVVGEPPLHYLTRFRVTRAADLLRLSDDSIKEIAANVGYDSEAAFNHAFKRAYGVAPGMYRKQGQPRAVEVG
jgi:AraC-like DNA-binding protein